MASACVYLECPVTHMILGVARKDDPNAWGLPGGKVEEGESEEDAARRELVEETGIRLYWTRDASKLLREIFRREGGVTYGLNGCHLFDLGVVFHLYARKKGEARVGWVTPEQLMAGPFGDYNRRLLTTIGRI